MDNKIIVAGGGHGGIAAAALLAKRGFEVTVYEQNSPDSMGYDWTDIFDPKSLALCEIPMPAEDKYEIKTNMTFYSTGMQTPLQQDVPIEKAEIKMERSDIYEHIINHAKDMGVHFEFNTKVLSAIIIGDRVVGIKTDKGDFYASLVIDACGIDSPVRQSLKPSMGVQKESGRYEKFYVYRAFFNKIDVPTKDKYKVMLLPEGITGVGWVATEEKYTDLLIGRFDPIDIDQANRAADYFRGVCPSLGTEVKRGGKFVKIPVRQPLSQMIANGYAAIGDSAYMTVPIIGSGIANSFRAARMLADVVVQDTTFSFGADVLWNYQKAYYKKLGNSLAVLACVKLLLTKLTGDELDYIFEKGILTAQDMTITADDTSIVSLLSGGELNDYINKVKYVCKDKVILGKILNVGKDIAKVIAITAVMPTRWDSKAVKLWASKYDSIFTVK